LGTRFIFVYICKRIEASESVGYSARRATYNTVEDQKRYIVTYAFDFSKAARLQA